MSPVPTGANPTRFGLPPPLNAVALYKKNKYLSKKRTGVSPSNF